MTLDEQIREVKREINLRQRVYPRWVESGRLKQNDAEHRLACMISVLDSLTALSQLRDPAEQA